MDINFTGHNVDVTPALRALTQEKFARLKRLHNNITSIKVTFGIENLTQTAEATLHIPKHEIHARAESEDLYSAIDDLTHKLMTQIKKYKEKEREQH